MAIEPDHIVLTVNERARSLAFYEEVVGLVHEGEDGPFSTLRVTPGFAIQLAERHTAGGDHVAFAMSPSEFEAAFARIRSAGVPYGDAFDTVGEMRGPGVETDPDRHLLEMRYYEENAT